MSSKAIKAGGYGHAKSAARGTAGEVPGPDYGAAALAEDEGNAFAVLVEQLPANREDAIDAIRGGFPAAVLKDAGQYFEVPASRIRAIVRLPETTALALGRRGANMDAGVSERIWRLADLAHMAREVFDSKAAATDWLRTPNRSFAGTAPIDCLDTEPGAMSVRQVLNAMATGGAA
ncbi:MAG TPA: antitoxin Xre/MbcA/ParS toxin-binding domain-containing protein [Telluria sp.]|nr:antitoxin Xre/MbcA/ParS toxin-binding domain-containing protein [Telluria sp.]